MITGWMMVLLTLAVAVPHASGQDSQGSETQADAAPARYTLDDYNASLVRYGIPFYSHYPASFYTGFAPRVEEPGRIHLRVGRGNQTRVTTVLDEYTVMTYLYYLLKRYDVYGVGQAKGVFQSKSMRQLDSYRKIVDSPVYDIRATTAAFDAKKIDRPELYEKSLATMTALNPGRVRVVEFDLRRLFLEWRDAVGAFAKEYGGEPTDTAAILSFIDENPNDSIVLTDSMLFGRTEAVYLDDEAKQQLAAIVTAVMSAAEDEDFLALAIRYFQAVTAGRYDVQIVEKGRFVPAIDCENPGKRCRLRYPEFTAVYPNGSTVAAATDRRGNTIHMIRNIGIWTFMDRPYHDVDHIRTEGYYGYAPKMDWQDIGNGVHNPGVSHWLPGMKHLYEQLGIPPEYQFMWVISRGSVSHGCVRFAPGHLWETRHIFPSNPETMKQLLYRGNYSEDYDLFDIDADGTLEVVGSEYFIAYSLKGASGDSRRKGKSFSADDYTRDDFYTHLYGEKGQFERDGDRYTFTNPHITYFRKISPEKSTGKPISRRLEGTYVLHESPYEKDKAQIYHLPSKFKSQLSIKDDHQSTGKQIIRVFGRISGCGPFKSEWSGCYEDEFDREFEQLMTNF